MYKCHIGSCTPRRTIMESKKKKKKKVNLEDLEAVDYELYEGFTWTLCVQTSHSRILTSTPLCFAGKITSWAC